MNIPEPCTYTVGPYTVRVQIRPDNPHWPQYLVFSGARFIGKHFSRPDVQCCVWLARQAELERLTYAEQRPRRERHDFQRGRMRGGQATGLLHGKRPVPL